MSNLSKFLVSAAVIGLAFYAGYRYRSPETVVKWKTKTEVKEVEKVVTVRTTERSTQPDGTHTEKIVEQVTQNTETKTQDTTSKAAPNLPTWSLGLRAAPQLTTPYLVPVSVEGGYRVIGNVWGTAEYNWREQEFSLGVRIEW